MIFDSNFKCPILSLSKGNVRDMSGLRPSVSGNAMETRMNEELTKLIERAKGVRMTAEQQEEQRRSFAYGNTKIENERITRDLIDREAERLAKLSK